MTTISRFVIALLFFIVPAAHAQQFSKGEEALREVIRQMDVVGLSVVVVKDNKMIYRNSFGLKDVEAKKPLTNDDIFRIASISKSFSATSIMQLAEQKKLSLDDDFSDLVGFKVRNPKFPDIPITLRMVMSHTSSINDSQGYFNLDAINPAKNADWAKCYNDYAPGAGYEYCNLNYNMIGAVIEKRSGTRFDQYVKSNVLDPLGLYGGYNVDALDNEKFVTLYTQDEKTKKFNPSPAAYSSRKEEISKYVMGYSTPIFSPTGGMKISATDLAKYMMMHMNYGKSGGKRIISKKSSRTMQTKIAEEEGYGLALTNRSDIVEGKTLVGHTGSAYGLFSAMFFDPKEKFGFVVITNGCASAYTRGRNGILNTTMRTLYDNFIR